MAITIKQIAELAEVSRGTVDRALNSRGGVNPEIEAKILKIAKDYGYKPNLAAKSLAMSQQNLSIGVIIYSESNEFFNDVIDGINSAKDEIAEFGISVLIKKIDGFNVEQELAKIDELINSGINALAITPINDERIIKKLESIKDLPIIALNTDVEGEHSIDYIGCNYYKSGQTAGAMMGLFSKGSGNILVITGSHSVYGHNQRVKGFIDVINAEYPALSIIDTVENKDKDTLSYDLVKRAVESDSSLSRFYFAAAGVDGGIQALKESGRIDDFVIVTCDTSPGRIELIKSGIIDATICQQPFEQGYQCIKELFSCIMTKRMTTGKKTYTKNEIKLKYNFN
ncbi:MAG: LacI family DNA-binding transcriptional regulator [Clostridia bacterium]|nr:LacI family DNA-binding transcriptional regulator [Clostridia bacterium]